VGSVDDEEPGSATMIFSLLSLTGWTISEMGQRKAQHQLPVVKTDYFFALFISYGL
jgi:hypothetical protein